MSQKITCPCCQAEIEIVLETSVVRTTQRSGAKRTPIDPTKRSQAEIDAEAQTLVWDGISLGQAQQMKVDPRVIDAMIAVHARIQG
jgi:hypothetical protein